MSYQPFFNYDESVSASKSFCFQKCKMLYSLKYKLKVKPLPKTLYFDGWLRMFRGNVLHTGFEAALLGTDPAAAIVDYIAKESAPEKQLTQEMKDALPEVEDSSRIIVENLVDWLPVSAFEPVMYQGKPLVEYMLTVPLPGWSAGFNGKVDAVIRHKASGRVVLIDWKTQKSFQKEGGEFYQVQLPMYLYGLRSIGLFINQFALIEIKSTPPKRAPRTIREDVGTFDGVRLSVDGQFRWSPRAISDTEIDNIYDQFAKMALNMSRFQHEYAYMNRNAFACRECEYDKICSAKLQGQDLPYVLQANYKCPPASLKILAPEETE